MNPSRPSIDPSLIRALWAVGLIGGVMVVVGGIVGGAPAATSIGVGALAAFGNLWVIARVVRGFLGGTARLPWTLIALVKFTALYGGLFLLVKSDLVQLMPLAIGWGALPLGIVAGQAGGAVPVDEKG